MGSRRSTCVLGLLLVGLAAAWFAQARAAAGSAVVRQAYLPLVARQCPQVGHSISDVSFDPPSPAALPFATHVTVRYRYTTQEAGGVRVWVTPLSLGNPVARRAWSGSLLCPCGRGTSDAWFTVHSGAGAVTVDEVSLLMVTAQGEKPLFEARIPVHYHFGP